MLCLIFDSGAAIFLDKQKLRYLYRLVFFNAVMGQLFNHKTLNIFIIPLPCLFLFLASSRAFFYCRLLVLISMLFHDHPLASVNVEKSGVPE